MRYALPGSMLVHVAVFGAAFVGFAWPDAEDAPAPGSVTVNIVALSSVSDNVSSIIQSSSSQNLVSSGAQAVASSQSPTLEALEPEPVSASAPVEQPLAPERQQPLPSTVQPAAMPPPPSAEPLEAEPLAQILTAAVQPVLAENVVVPQASQPVEEPVAIEPVVPMLPDVVEPDIVTDAKVAPVPQTLSFKRPSEPTPRQEPKPRRTQQAQTEPAQRPASQAGNGGQNEADAAAAQASAGQGGAGAGGQADVARWQSQVQRRLANSLRYPRAAGGERGEVVVRFTVAQQGGASAVSIVRSSGNAVLDQAAIETVGRATPFPPIPANAGFASKTFDFPLGFVRN